MSKPIMLSENSRKSATKEKEVTVYPRHELTVKGKKVPAGEFMNRDKGTEQVLRALGLRCGVEKYRATRRYKTL